MLKRQITYEDFDGNTITETFYFNLSKRELITMQVSMDGGLQKFLEHIVEETNEKELIEKFQWIILQTYGERSEDGKRFFKSEEIRAGFEAHAAFEALWNELTTNANAAATFINGIIPRDVAEQVAKEYPQDKPAGLPPRPPSRV